MPLSGAQVTRLSPYGGPAGQYGNFDPKVAEKTYTATFTRHSIYGGIGIPYGSFGGKSGGVPVDLVETAGAAISGTVGVSGDIEIKYEWQVEAPLEVSLAGVVGVSGDIQIGVGEPFSLVETSGVSLAGTVGVSGDLEIGTSFDVAQTANAALAGTVGVSGDIEIGTSFDVAQTANVGLSGVIGVTGDIETTVSFGIAQTANAELSGVIGVTGDLEYSTTPRGGGKGDNEEDGWAFSRYRSFNKQTKEAQPKRKKKPEPAFAKILGPNLLAQFEGPSNPVIPAELAGSIKQKIRPQPEPKPQRDDEDDAIALILMALS